MGKEEDYENKLEVLKAIAEGKVRKPHNIPVAVYIQEADKLYHWVQEDREALIRAGISWDMVEDMPVRIGVLIVAEANFQARRQPWGGSQRELNNRYAEAVDLKKSVLGSFRYAFQEHPALMKTVGEISMGRSRAALVQALNDLSVLGKGNLSLLGAIHFDVALLERAAGLSVELSKLVAAAVVERMRPNEAADIRNRAYTHLKEAVDAVRDCGRFVFSGNKERRKGYISEYVHRVELRRARNSKKQAEKEEKELGKAENVKPVLRFPGLLTMITEIKKQG